MPGVACRERRRSDPAPDTRNPAPATPTPGPLLSLPFVSRPIARLAEHRRDGAWLSAQLDHPDARWLLLADLRVALDAAGAPLALPGPAAAALRARGGDWVLLGEVEGHVWFALDVGADAADPARAPEAELAGDPPTPLADAQWSELRPLALTVRPDVAALLAQARGLLAWHARHPRCAVCGASTAAEEAGYVRRCVDAACDAMHFPRTDPAIITLVTHGDRCLLANGTAWPASMHSTVAGYVEPGESLEDAVRREVREETGVTVGAVRYVASQPWPFPSSLMLGFAAAATSTAITVDGEEVRSARWFTRDELDRAVADGSVTLPSRMSIAWMLVDAWRRGELADPGAA